jgi:hypothetical protein
VKPLVVIGLVAVLVAAVAGVARADASKQTGGSVKLPASARVFVLDKEAPPTEKTTQLPRSRPTLKQKL